MVTIAVRAAPASLSACGRSDSSSSAASSGAAQVKTDFGVDASTITLGTLTDASGQFAAFSKPIVVGNQMYFDSVNKAGGICGRQGKLIVKDRGYEVNKEVPPDG